MPNRTKFSITIGLMALTALVITLDRPVELDATAGIRTALPDRIGPYRGERILFCQSEACLRSFRESDLTSPDACPACDGVLSRVSLAEKQILPADTLLEKMMYTGPGSARLFVSIVVSGSEQRSIHRPQQCLPAQGVSILNSRVITVDAIPGRDPLDLMVLGTQQAGHQAGGKGIFAYWFVGGGHETPHHLKRLFLNAVARVFSRRAPRWAYVSISADTHGSRDSSERTLKQLVRALAPELALPADSQ